MSNNDSSVEMSTVVNLMLKKWCLKVELNVYFLICLIVCRNSSLKMFISVIICLASCHSKPVRLSSAEHKNYMLRHMLRIFKNVQNKPFWLPLASIVWTKTLDISQNIFFWVYEVWNMGVSKRWQNVQSYFFNELALWPLQPFNWSNMVCDIALMLK